MFEPLIGTAEASALLHMHPKTLQAKCRAGKVPAIKIGKGWWFRESQLDSWVSEQLSCHESRRGEEL